MCVYSVDIVVALVVHDSNHGCKMCPRCTYDVSEG